MCKTGGDTVKREIGDANSVGGSNAEKTIPTGAGRRVDGDDVNFRGRRIGLNGNTGRRGNVYREGGRCRGSNRKRGVDLKIGGTVPSGKLGFILYNGCHGDPDETMGVFF